MCQILNDLFSVFRLASSRLASGMKYGTLTWAFSIFMAAHKFSETVGECWSSKSRRILWSQQCNAANSINDHLRLFTTYKMFEILLCQIIWTNLSFYFCLMTSIIFRLISNHLGKSKEASSAEPSACAREYKEPRTNTHVHRMDWSSRSVETGEEDTYIRIYQVYWPHAQHLEGISARGWSWRPSPGTTWYWWLWPQVPFHQSTGSAPLNGTPWYRFMVTMVTWRFEASVTSWPRQHSSLFFSDKRLFLTERQHMIQ